MNRILFYCQYYSSLGPAFRTLGLCRKLIQDFSVDCLLGHPEQVEDVVKIDSPRFHRLILPSFGKVEERVQAPPSSEEMMKRKGVLDQFLPGRHYDLFLTEMFPFSKTYLLPEVLYIMQQINPDCQLVSVMRDAADRSSEDFAPLTCQLVNQLYDAVLVLADPQILKLEDSFPLAAQIQKKLFYTGYVPQISAVKSRQKQILVSLGSGGLGEELGLAVKRVKDAFSDYRFIFVTGPHATDALKEHLKECETLPFIRDFATALSESALSISTGGSSLIEVAYTKTPALAYAAEMSDQPIRTRAFAAKNLLRELKKTDLDAERLIKIIQEQLRVPPPAFLVAMNGAQEACRILHELTKSKGVG